MLRKQPTHMLGMLSYVKSNTFFLIELSEISFEA